MALSQTAVERLRERLGTAYVRADREALDSVSADALGIPGSADLVVLPASADEVSFVARTCHETRTPLVVRGAGTGYTGGAVPTQGGVVLSMERMNRIREIDELNLLAIVEPNVVTGDLQRAVEALGLFYPPDPASLETCSIGGNVAECAGGPRAFKYGTTRQYVLALEAVLPTGEIVRTGSKAVKNVVGYDLTRLLVGSEGTLAIVTAITVRLVPLPAARVTLTAAFTTVTHACEAVTELIRRRAVPAAIELVDGQSLRAVEDYTRTAVAPAGTGAILIVECDGGVAAVAEEAERVRDAFDALGASAIRTAESDDARDEVWAIRRQLSLALRATGLLKINHDVVVPRGRVPELFVVLEQLRQRHDLSIAAFGHAGDGNIHVNVMIDPTDPHQRARATAAERELFEAVVQLEGSITGEHGIGFAKARYLGIELSPETIALMKRVKSAFDPHGILNPGKIF